MKKLLGFKIVSVLIKLGFIDEYSLKDIETRFTYQRYGIKNADLKFQQLYTDLHDNVPVEELEEKYKDILEISEPATSKARVILRSRKHNN